MAKPFDATTKELLEKHPRAWLEFLLGRRLGEGSASSMRICRRSRPRRTRFSSRRTQALDGSCRVGLESSTRNWPFESSDTTSWSGIATSCRCKA